MNKPSDDNEPLPPNAPKLQLELCGSGPGNGARTAVGTSDHGDNIDPTLIAEAPPFWFSLLSGLHRSQYYNAFSKADKEEVFKTMEMAKIPPLCRLILAVRWDLLLTDEFDYLDLKVVFQAAGHDTSSFNKLLAEQEIRALYRLYARGFRNPPHSQSQHKEQ
jgi:hypothetical protein